MSDEVFLFEEISVPVSNFSAGIATSIGYSPEIPTLTDCSSTTSLLTIKLFQFHSRQSREYSVLVMQQQTNRTSHHFIDCRLSDQIMF